MTSQQHEIEALVEDLIEDVIMEFFETSFNTKKQAAYGLEVLKQKIEEYDSDIFDELFD